VRRVLVACLGLLAATGSVGAQFLETFDDPELRFDPSGVEGWSFFSGDGEAEIDLRGTGKGYATIVVDATSDRRNVWWALIKHRVSENMDLEQLAQPGWELRVEARIRSSHAPRRVNLHVNTQRTTDFHSHLMEYDIPEAEKWHTISMTTQGFPVEVGDSVAAQMALMDWGLGRYRVDIDSFKVDVVEASSVGPDLGEPLPYHPPIPDRNSFEYVVPATENAVIDVAEPGLSFGTWSQIERNERRQLLTVGGSMWVVLRWDLEAFAGRNVTGHGLLELTTHAVQKNAIEAENSGLLRLVEILGGDPSWSRADVTADSLLRGEPLEEAVNPQMIIDWPVTETAGGKTWFVIPRPVLQRLIDGRTRGVAIRALGPIVASFPAGGIEAPRLLINIEQ
jgi:hypothetical protein